MKRKLVQVSVDPEGYIGSMVAEANDKYFLLSIREAKYGVVEGNPKDIDRFIKLYQGIEDSVTIKRKEA